MKAFFEQLITGIESSVSIIELNMTHFDGPYHFHPELELTWIQKGTGRRYLGDNVSDYGPDDLVLVGANVPHCWLSGKETTPNKAQAIVIQFQPNFAGETFLELPELTKIQNLIKKANAGIIFNGNTKEKIKSKMVQCTSAVGFSRLLRFFEILDLAANSKEIETVAPYSAAKPASPAETERFQKVFSYMIGNYQQEISLKAVARISNLTPTAFCRYLKNVTRKTLVEIVTEFRINHACQMLRNSKKSVNEICFECGFGNISYFNKTFKAFTKFSPLQYRRLLLGQ
jgi:AraC-like DNA-binding protein/mannose-6-phosphate isomerase-like protein (cupin superfamily)